jgi:tRNA-2-methylthio-N6-dimethylallyladenosine synthase
MPEITITTDIIVGFPGENDEDFEKTLELVKKVGYDSMFTFIYSRRKGTLAATFDDPETPQDKQRRFDKLLEVQNGISRKINEKYLGKTCKVLIDGFSEDNRYTYTGRTDGFKLVHINGASGYMGQWVDVEIDRTSTWALFGSIK